MLPDLALARQEVRPAEAANVKPDARPASPIKERDESRPGASVQTVTKKEASADLERERSDFDEKERAIRSNLESIFASAYRLESIEFRIIAEIEAASLMWEMDKERAHSVLLGVFDRMRVLQRDDRSPKTQAGGRPAYEKLKMWILRKVARIDPKMVTEMLSKDDGNESHPPVAGDWSEEGRAILAVAFEQIDRDPSLAGRLAQQSLTLGLVDIPGFLRKLSQSDMKLAQEQALSLITQLRDSSASPFFLLNFQSFVLMKGSPASLRGAYFEALNFRLHRNLGNELPIGELEDTLQAARAAARLAGVSPQWQGEFNETVAELERVLTSRSQAIPAPTARIAVDMPEFVSTDGNTADMADAAARAASIPDSKHRNEQYCKLAVAAAMKADARLAEDLLSRINDEESRRSASVAVYSPLVRKAVRESNWTQASAYAMKISEPLGRSLVIDSISRGIRDKQTLKDLYDAALAQSRSDAHTWNAVKGALVLAQSLLTSNNARSSEGLGWAVYLLNNCREPLSLLSDSNPDPVIQSWVTLPSTMHRSEEALEGVQLIGTAFEASGRRDSAHAQALALGLSSRSLSLLAQTAVARAEWEKIKRFKRKPVQAVALKAGNGAN
ncbi:MAG: hypothetical protein DMF61_09185 [Blastocatellia bacterium AA13]|nr:MAG: hypothetical protein DMF61_09185 [Blastocatellia bacterium AA13]